MLNKKLLLGVAGVFFAATAQAQEANTTADTAAEAPDFDYELNFTGRMDVEMKNSIKLSPFIQYFQAKARGADEKGDNLLIGVSLGYSHLFDL